MLSIRKRATEKTGFASVTMLSRVACAVFILAGFSVFATLLVPQANAQVAKMQPPAAPPCCNIKSINAQTGIVTAVEKATGRSFQFSVKDQALLKGLRVGQSVSADFNSGMVTIYGASPCCEITSLGGQGTAGNTIKGQMQPGGPCCEITGMDASGSVTAQNNTTGKAFQFQVNDSSMLNSLHLGQSVSADFNSSLVTIYGAPCCQITNTGLTSGAGTVPSSGGAPGGAKPQSQAAASSKASLGTAESDLPGIRMELLELRRVGNSVSVKFNLFNDGSKEFELGYSFGGWDNIQNAYVIDPLTNTKYPVITEGGCQCSSNVPHIASKSKALLWAKFAVPPQVQRLSVMIPRFAPLEDVPISAGP